VNENDDTDLGRPSVPLAQAVGGASFPPPAVGPALQTDLGLALATKRRRPPRDQRLRREVRQLLTYAPHLRDVRYAVGVNSLCLITCKIRDCNNALLHRPVLNESGELRSSLDTIGRLVSVQLKLLKSLGLTPDTLNEIMGGPRGGALDGAFERIEKAHAERHGVVEDAETEE
jgi:hypothetical protein